MAMVALISFSLVFSQEQRSKSLNAFIPNQTLSTQQSSDQTGYIRCETVEYEAYLQNKYPERASEQEFENWMAEKKQEMLEQRALSPNVLQTLPIIFHIFTDGSGPENVTEALVQAQVAQLNIDYRNLAGSTYTQAADSEIEFCLAAQDESGIPLSEPGINRITTYGQGPFTRTDFENTLKAATQWDPTRYFNVWVADISGGILGYAQFPDSSGLAGLNPSGGAASTDGVVVAYYTVGSIANPNPNGAPYDSGRTLTHEAGHWLGLRHTWGDNWSNGDPTNASCGFDDYCNDTPDSGQPNYGCPGTAPDTCFPPFGESDMFENYMDYSNDACMHTFTADQVARMLTVLQNSPRRSELVTSTVCEVPSIPLINFGSVSPDQIIEGNGCSYQDITIDLYITIAPSETATATLVDSGTATENADFELLSNSVTFNSGSTTPSNSITLRVFEDGFVESDESISLSISVTTTGDAIGSTNTYDLIIGNDDDAITESTSATVFSDDFSDGDASDWTAFDNDGQPLDDWFIAEESNWDPQFGIYTDYFMVSYSWNGDPYTPDNFLVSPMISIPSGGTSANLRYFAGSGSDATYFNENYEVYISNSAGSVANILAGTLLVDTVLPFQGGQYYDVDISGFAGQDVYISFRHHDTVDEWLLGIDEVSVSVDGETIIQTDMNTGTPDQLNLSETGNAFSTDPTSGNLILDIDNTGGFDYGCSTVSVSRDAAAAGGDAVMYNMPGVANYVFAKTFDITTTNTNTGDNSTINFYFTEAEVSAWETTTGNNRNSLYVKKEGTNEIVAATTSTFGSDVKVSASFTTGLSGTYIFGIQAALLSANTFELENSITIYPNPVDEKLSIKLSNSDLPDGYKIYNLLGQLIKENTISNMTDLEINTSELSKGMYFLKISKNNKSLALPFIKN